MNAFRGIFLATIISILLWILIALGLWMWIFREPIPAFSHPPMTLQEKQMIRSAIRYHGDWPITREGYEGVWIMTRGEERIRL
jgi:hypothetical protein